MMAVGMADNNPATDEETHGRITRCEIRRRTRFIRRA
jgi:CRISPR/Cas system type I-B associated protein Csh2 (Cas7 group RAMP superfamily)